MNTIKWVSLKKENTRRTPRIRYIEIKHESGFLTLKDTLNAPKIAQSNNSIVLWLDDKTKTRELKGFNHYSKEQLENFQKTILFDYILT